jgi:ABC-2 type transport system ATP-binding protein
MSENETVMSLDRLTVRYGRLLAVDRLDLEVGRGSVCALLGRNGAGKTSLVHALLGQIRPSGGNAMIFELDVWRYRRQLMARVGVVPERPEIPPAMTAKQLDRFFAALYPNWNADSFHDRLRRFRLPKTRPFGRFSKGQQRQLALSLALGSDPELLVLDDPTLGLDPVARRSLYEELVGELADRGTTVFLATHDLAGIEGIADRIAVMRGGSLLLSGPLEQIKNGFRRLRLAAPGDRHRWAELAGRLGVISSREVEGCFEAVVSEWDEREWASSGIEARVAPMSLEEIFVALCGDGMEAMP